MVQYLASTATTQINVITSEVATILTITARAEVTQGEPFIIEGTLSRADTGMPLSGEQIALSYNGTSLGTTTTRDFEGGIRYSTQVQIDTIGDYTLTATFAGSERAGLILRPSSQIGGINIGANANIPVILGGITALSLLLMTVSLK